MRPKNDFVFASLTFAAFVALTTPGPSRADWIYFAKGGQVEAEVRREKGRVWVETPGRRYLFHDQDFRKIVPGGSPRREWPSRRDAALSGGADRQFAAAWWALENGLIPETVAMLRSAHEADPKHQPTARMVAMLDRLEQPCIDPDTDLLSHALGVSFEVERGPRILLLHQHDPAEARSRLDLLERVTTAYYLMLVSHGLDLTVPKRRLVSVYFRRHPDYQKFLESQGVGTFRTTLGYFHPNFRAVVMYDPRPDGKAIVGRGMNLLASSDASKGLQDLPDRLRDGDLERRALLADLTTGARADGTAAHEMIHLLVVTSDLAADPGVFPLWLHEGFAAQFEVIRGGQWAGIGRAHDLRIPDWRALSTPAELEPLIRDIGFGHGYRRDLYAKSWGLVYFLRKTRPREFSAFLDLLRLPDPISETSDPARFDRAFRSAFGADMRALESEWCVFMSKVSTPLEENIPLPYSRSPPQ